VINSEGLISVRGQMTEEHLGEHRMTVVARDLGDPPMETQANVVLNIISGQRTTVIAVFDCIRNLQQKKPAVEFERRTMPPFVPKTTTKQTFEFELTRLPMTTTREYNQ
jgi:hypothetical protein